MMIVLCSLSSKCPKPFPAKPSYLSIALLEQVSKQSGFFNTS